MTPRCSRRVRFGRPGLAADRRLGRICRRLRAIATERVMLCSSRSRRAPAAIASLDGEREALLVELEALDRVTFRAEAL